MLMFVVYVCRIAAQMQSYILQMWGTSCNILTLQSMASHTNKPKNWLFPKVYEITCSAAVGMPYASKDLLWSIEVHAYIFIQSYCRGIQNLQ